MKFTSLFSGFGLVDIGAKVAGFELVAANEIDPKIADVYRMKIGNGVPPLEYQRIAEAFKL